MHDIENPYAAPISKAQESKSASNGALRQLFSPTQGAMGAFLLGPITGVYIIQANFAAMGESARRGHAIVYGSLLIVAVALLSPFVPEKVPAIAFGLLYMIPTRWVMEKFQPSKQQIIGSHDYVFRSNWLVFGIGLVGIVVYMIVIVAIYLVYSAIGWVPKLW